LNQCPCFLRPTYPALLAPCINLRGYSLKWQCCDTAVSLSLIVESESEASMDHE